MDENLAKKLDSAPVREVSLGHMTVKVLTSLEIDQAQIGYAVDSKGNSLSGNEPGDWRPSWVVISIQDLDGDPVFVDKDVSDYPVYTAMHGQDAWDPEIVSTSLAGFIEALLIVAPLSQGRTTPIQFEQHPLSDDEIRQALVRIRSATEVDDPAFWEDWLTQG